jgi:alanine racemase
VARALLTVDLDAVVANWQALDAKSGPEVETAAVVKADGYGLGAAEVGRALAAAGVRTFFVALVEEGVALRAALGPGPEILVFSGPLPGDAAAIREAQLVPCLNSADQVETFANVATGDPCAVQVDSGMNRLGLEEHEVAALADVLAELKPRLVFSHLACADTPGHAQNDAQATAFGRHTAAVPAARHSLAATGGILLGASYHHDLVRPGIGLFGGLPFAQARPVVRLELPVIQVREVADGESVGYGADWTARRPSRIATVSAGYADGLLRALAGGSVALFADGQPCPMVGRVSMDLVTVDVTAVTHVPDRMEILNANQGIDDLAAAAGTIGYEILTSLGGRYERSYLGAVPGPDR